MEDGEGEAERLVVPVIWVGGDDLPTFAANQFLVQVDRGEVFLTVGHLTPPVLVGDDPDVLREQAARIDYVAVRTVTKLSLSPSRLQELVKLLERAIEMTEKGEHHE